MRDVDTGLTAEVLRTILLYDPATGEFTWRKGRGRLRSGLLAGMVMKSTGRRMIEIKEYNHSFLTSRLAWLYMKGEWPKGIIDHKNHRRADDRWENLREATSSQSMANKPLRKDNKSGVSGVYGPSDSGLWLVTVKFDGRKVLHKHFKSRRAAVIARNKTVRKHHGEFAVFH